MLEFRDDEAERRELEKFLDAIERNPWNTGRSPGIRRTDLTPMGCAANVLLFVGFFLMIFKPLVGVPMFILAFPLYLSADARRRRKRLAYAEPVPAIEPAARPPARGAVPSDAGGNLPQR
jgi:hypothetical protein